MDKSWINLQDKACHQYLEGINNFLNFAFERATRNNTIICPCQDCLLDFQHSRNDVFQHLAFNGFMKGYTKWTLHGEESAPAQSTSVTQKDLEGEDDIEGLLRDVFPSQFQERTGPEYENTEDYGINQHPERRDKFFDLLEDAKQVLYPNCKNHTKLSCVVHLYHLKCLNRWSDKSFSMLLEFLKGVLPEGNILPKSFYEAKKLISGLGLNYEKIHACPNDCMLFWKDDSTKQVCDVCGVSRWQSTTCQEGNEIQPTKTRKKPAKILRWFPLIPRLQRLFMCSKTASEMTWHEDGRVRDGKMRHPADSKTWKHFSSLYPDFSSETRNVYLGLASDGFNPFRTMNVSHSTWPVLLIPYNLPPWLCMKQENIILSLLIPGPKGPGDKFDVYMQPLIDELRELWDVGVQTFDVAKKETFTMRAMLLWTINDFPAYATLSGWSTRGALACPICGPHTSSKWLHYGGKYCYMCHRRWLEENHRYRYETRSFDGGQELRSAPIPLSGTEILGELEKNQGGQSSSACYQLKKKTILFSLPYWEHHLLRHNLDLMHIEKNVCDNIIFTIMGVGKKSKDNYKARLDLQKLGLRSELHPKSRPGNGRPYLPKACYEMTVKEKDVFLNILKDIKAPDEVSSNISRCVQLKQRKLIGLKSHDSHVLIQEFFPIAICGSLPDHVSRVLIDISNFFRGIWSKTLGEDDIDQMQSEIALTLCQMEKKFPPSFFTIMVHLLIHLPAEAKLGGPAPCRTMYFIERHLSTLKSHLRNRAHPEASIAEGYIANECLTFCSRYLSRVETRFNRPGRNEDGDLEGQEVNIYAPGRPLGRKSVDGFNVRKRKRVRHEDLDDQTLIQAHRYVLYNCDAITPFLDEHEKFLRRQARPRRLSPYDIQKAQSKDFVAWFREQVERLDKQGSTRITDEMRILARGPLAHVQKHTGYVVNGYRFHTKAREIQLKAQNSGVMVIAETRSYSTTRDNRPVSGEVAYYGQLTDIIQLNYYGSYKVTLFKCDWVDINRGCKTDNFGFKLVNFLHLAHTGHNIHDEPFVFASHAKKVYYVTHPLYKDWMVVRPVKLRDVYDMGDESSINIDHTTDRYGLEDITDTPCDTYSLVRNDVEVEEGYEVTAEDEIFTHEERGSESEVDEDF